MEKRRSNFNFNCIQILFFVVCCQHGGVANCQQYVTLLTYALLKMASYIFYWNSGVAK